MFVGLRPTSNLSESPRQTEPRVLQHYRFSIVFTVVCLALAVWYGLESTGTVAGTARLVENRRAGIVSEPRVVDLKPDGSFVFPHVPAGQYVLQVRGDGPVDGFVLDLADIFDTKL